MNKYNIRIMISMTDSSPPCPVRQVAELEARLLVRDAENSELRLRLGRNGTLPPDSQGGPACLCLHLANSLSLSLSLSDYLTPDSQNRTSCLCLHLALSSSNAVFFSCVYIPTGPGPIPDFQDGTSCLSLHLAHS